MNEPSQLSHFLEAHEKNEPEAQPHCYRRGGVMCREQQLLLWQVFWGWGAILQQISVLKTWPKSRSHALQPLSHTGQISRQEDRRQAGPGIKAQLSTPSFHFLSPLATADHHRTQHYDFCRPNWRKGHPQPFLGHSGLNLPNKKQWHLQFSGKSPMA